MCFWDSVVIQRALENLASNAIKYGQEQTKVTITSKQVLDTVEISVHNSGKPIPPEEQKDLFNMYHRTNEAQSGNQKGWGIGLSNVEGMIKAHNGAVTLKSDLDSGTTFTLKIPRDPRKR